MEYKREVAVPPCSTASSTVDARRPIVEKGRTEVNDDIYVHILSKKPATSGTIAGLGSAPFLNKDKAGCRENTRTPDSDGPWEGVPIACPELNFL